MYNIFTIVSSQGNVLNEKIYKLLDNRYVRGGDLNNAYLRISHSSYGSSLWIHGSWVLNSGKLTIGAWEITGNTKD